jgi:hypothetical protein
MAEQTRNPRIDPMPGDVLRKKYQGRLFECRAYNEREVFDVDGGRVTYVGENVCSPDISLASWRKWAKGTTITKQAKEGTK